MGIAALLTPLLFAVAMADKENPPNADLVAQAETAFHRGMEMHDHLEQAGPFFHKAASCYEELRRRGAHNADLYRNQGNCYLLAGDLPRAILSYRRGLRLDPADPALRTNLAHAREQVVYPARGDFGRPTADNLPTWLLYLSPRLCLLLFVCFYSIGWVGFIRWWMAGRAAPLGIGIMAFLLTALPTARLAVEAWSEREQALHPLVILNVDKVPLRRGNGPLYPPRFESSLNRGVEASLQFERGQWLQIELADGAVGWVPRAAVLLDPT
jgi:hypothetical protein